MNSSPTTPETLCETAPVGTMRRRFSIGLPSGLIHGERRFPLTPEAASMLSERGFEVVIEEGAGAPIHYSDSAYVFSGAKVATRAETLRCDVVISLAPLSTAEIKSMKRSALLLSMAPSVIKSGKDAAKALLDSGITTLALERIEDESGHKRVADILHEIDGCASLSIASALLTDPIHGKGILLGGVTGIVPCEVTVLGSGMGAIAAAHCALGMGATVRMFDNDIYSLRQAGRVLEHRVISSVLHPHVLEGALRTADIVIATPLVHKDFSFTPEMISCMKKRALVFDITQSPGQMFPTLPLFNLGEIAERERAATTERACYFNVGCQVPRTAAMALSNCLIALSHRFVDATGQIGASSLMLRPGIRAAAMTAYGKAVDPELAEVLGVRPIDVNLFTSLS